MGLGFRRLLALPADAKILFATRAVRMFAYGLLGLLLVLYMKKLDLRDDDIGAFLMLTLLGDCAVSLLVASNADKMGRRFMLSLGAASMACTGILFAIVPTFGAFNKWFTGRSEEESDLPADLNAVQGWIYFSILLVIGVVGVISPSGTEVGPFQAIEQSLLVKFIPFEHRATLFAWYTLFGSVMTALGSLLAGFVVSYLTERDFSALAGTYHNISMAALTFGSNMNRTKVYESKNQQVGDGNDGLFTKLEAYRCIVFAYGLVGILLLASFRLLSKDMEVEPEIPSESPIEEADDEVLEDDEPNACATESQQPRGLMRIASFGSIFRARNASSAESSPLLGGQRNTTTSFIPGLNLSPQTRWTVLKLCMLFTLDSFGSSIMNGGMLAYWFSYRFQVDEAYLGKLLFGSNVLCGVSALLAGMISQRVGLVNTMVFTHLPSNLIMMMVPFAHNLYWATTLVFIRALISQMDVGPRTAFISSIVPANERTSVIGLITTVRTLGAAFGPFLTGFMAEQGWFDVAFLLSGGLSAFMTRTLRYRAPHGSISRSSSKENLKEPFITTKRSKSKPRATTTTTTTTAAQRRQPDPTIPRPGTTPNHKRGRSIETSVSTKSRLKHASSKTRVQDINVKSMRWADTLQLSLSVIPRLMDRGLMMALFSGLVCGVSWFIGGVPSEHSLVSIFFYIRDPWACLYLRSSVVETSDRYWEAAKLWSALRFNLIKLTLAVQLNLKPETRTNELKKKETLKLLAGIPGYIKEQLSQVDSKQPSNTETGSALLLTAQPNSMSIPHKILQAVAQNLVNQHAYFGFSDLSAIDEHISQLNRIRTTPIPQAYSLQMKQVVFLFLLTLPLQLVPSLGMLTVPACTITAFGLLGLIEVAELIEMPFGDGMHHLPMDLYCDTIGRDLVFLAPKRARSAVVSVAGSKWTRPSSLSDD
ncbi:hypothetical protein HDU78_011463 [Chytriomyces hyalinus]|nr:hypothetical protein HDU78_011463 [Chytriomyces hyalinus]